METVSVNKFRENLKGFAENVIEKHEPLKITRRHGEDFVVVSFEDWERQEETLHVLQSKSLMKQIAESTKTFIKTNGYCPTKEQMDEINSI